MMSASSLCLALCLALLVAGAAALPLDTPFATWKAHFGVSYPDAATELHHRAIFRRNADAASSLYSSWLAAHAADAAARSPPAIALGALADRAYPRLPPMAPKDLPCTVHKGFPASPATDFNASVISALPAAFDWRTDHPANAPVVVPVRNQGSVGTCYAFSAVDCIASAVALAQRRPVVTLSVEQVVDCSPAFDCGVFGGWPCRTMQHAMATGLMTEAAYPYCVGTGDCYPCVPPDYNRTFCGPPPTYCNATQFPCKYSAAQATTRPAGWRRLSEDPDQLRATLVHQGPISVLMDATLLQMYDGSGVWDPPSCNPTALDHAVLLVGYGVEKDVFGTYPYWIVQNSWGASWGEKGFFKIVRGKDTCGIESAAVNAIASPV